MTAAQYNLLRRMADCGYVIKWWRGGHNGGTWRLYTTEGNLVYYGAVQPDMKHIIALSGWVKRDLSDRLCITDAGREAINAHNAKLEARRAKLKGGN